LNPFVRGCWSAISLRRSERADNLEEIVDFIFALEHSLGTISVDDGEGGFVQTIDSDRSKARDMVLQQREESRLLRRERRVLAGEGTKALLAELCGKVGDDGVKRAA
jgi:hypothetical protein